MDINMDILGYIDTNITVNVIKNGKIIKKTHMELPEKLINIHRHIKMMIRKRIGMV